MASWRREPNSPRGGDLNVSSQRGEEFRVDERAVRVLHDGQPVWGRREGDEIVLPGDARIAEADAHYLAPAEPTKVIAVHLTYRSRIEEYKARTPAEPSYFMKPPTALNGHRGEVRRPKGTSYLNYEGELAVVIGRRMHGVPVEEALDYVAGYTCANDVGLHDFRHADRGSMLRVKGQDGFLPLGPELVPAGEFDPTSFHPADVPQRRGRPGGRRERPDLGRRVPARRSLPAHHARARRRRAHRHAGQLEADGAGRRR